MSGMNTPRKAQEIKNQKSEIENPEFPMSRPNILIFMPDQMHRETIGPGGLCRTPNFDMLARDGAVFTHAFTPTPICTPARASTFTGLLPHQHALLHNSHMDYPIQNNLPEGMPTFADELGKAGYETYYTGKWHVGKTNAPVDHGFGQVGEMPGHSKFPEDKFTDEILVPNRSTAKNTLAATTSESVEETQPWLVCKTAAEMIFRHDQERSGQPFLLFASTDMPHVPWCTPESYVARYDPDGMEPWPNYDDNLEDKPIAYRKHYNGWDYCRVPNNWPLAAKALAHYYGMVSLIDEAFGQILRALETTGQRENTLIIVTSDHGELMGRHGLFGKNEMLSEDLVRVPLILTWPARIGCGEKRDEMVTLCDLFSTVVDSAGLSARAPAGGRSLLSLFDERQSTSDWPDEVYLEHHGDLQYNVVRGIRDRRYKYVYWANDLDEFYDLEKDPWEQRNLAGDAAHGDLLRKWRIRLLSQMEKTDDPFLRGVRSNLENEVI